MKKILSLIKACMTDNMKLFKVKENNKKLSDLSDGTIENKFNDAKQHEKELIDEIASLKKENDNLRKSNKKLLELDSKRTDENIADLKKQNEMLLASNRELNELNKELMNSNSWKITKPLRQLKK